jgi:membrane-bound serine protease (ClpP class)
MVSLGCDQIYMHPSARLGDVGVVAIGPGGEMSNADAKAVAEVVTIMRELANVKGRPPALAEAMVDRRVKVFRVRDKKTQREWFLTEHEISELGEDSDWEVLQPLRETQDRFLEVTGERAVELQLAQGTVRDLRELKQALGLTADPEVLEATWVDKTVYILNQPWVTGLLFLIGLVAMYIEFNMPGIGAGAAVSVLCFTLFFWSHWAGGTASWLEILMFVLGVAFVAFEIFVIPGFGFAGILGGILILASIFMASQRVVIPETAYDMRLLRNSALSLVLAIVGFLGVVAVLRKRIGTGQLFSNLVLMPPTAAETGGLQSKAKIPVPVNDAGLAETPPPDSGWIGRRGRATTYLRPAGKVRFGNETVQVVAADGEFIDAGHEVEVVREIGNVIEVKQVS